MTTVNSNIPTVPVDVAESLYFVLLEFAQARGETVGEYIRYIALHS